LPSRARQHTSSHCNAIAERNTHEQLSTISSLPKHDGKPELGHTRIDACAAEYAGITQPNSSAAATEYFDSNMILLVYNLLYV
jgi:hypothetical protein